MKFEFASGNYYIRRALKYIIMAFLVVSVVDHVPRCELTLKEIITATALIMTGFTILDLYAPSVVIRETENEQTENEQTENEQTENRG